MNVEHEVKLLVQELKRLGSPNADGQTTVKFGVLFSDDRCANIFEGTVVNHHNDFKMEVQVTDIQIWGDFQRWQIGLLGMMVLVQFLNFKPVMFPETLLFMLVLDSKGSS